MNRKGFTLIELAIVLVIIGIILGAVIKGQDLIQNARAKKLVSETKQWEVALWTCYDRIGKFPGDTGTDGLIDSDPLSDACIQRLSKRPGHTVNLGSYTFYIYAGNDGTRNLIAVCGATNCGSVTADDTYADFLRAIDVSIDGADTPTTDSIRLINTISVSSNVVSAATPASSGSWSSTSKGALYFFDRQP